MYESFFNPDSRWLREWQGITDDARLSLQVEGGGTDEAIRE